jgi:Sporulation related domain.
MGFSIFVVIIVLAVAAGYAGTKYVVYPYLLDNRNQIEDASEQPKADGTATDAGVDVTTNTPSVIIDKQDIKNTTDNSTSTDGTLENPGSTAANSGSATAKTGNGPYCVQFGSFSTRESAETLSSELTGKGIYSYILESGGAQKVLGLPYTNQEKAKEAVAIVSSEAADAFVVDLSTLVN